MNKQEDIYGRDKWQEELEGLYNTAIECGYSPMEAQAFCKVRMQYLCECEDYGDPYESIELLYKIHLDCVKEYKKDEKAYKDILWHSGMNTKKPIWEDVLVYMEGPKRMIDVFVCGTERTDAGWTDQKKSPASFEARVRKANDRSLSRELNKLSNRGGGYFI